MRTRLLFTSALIFLAAVLIYGGNLFWSGPQDHGAPAYNRNNLIRLHIIANSDSPRDQELKLKVRDAILATGVNLFQNTTASGEAASLIQENLHYLETVARETLQGEGKNYPVRAELGVFPFPTRTYGRLTLPQGQYRALRLIIGEGKGHNWWCVLFPPLCFLNTEKEAQLAPGAGRLAQEPRGPVQFKLKLLAKAKEVDKAATVLAKEKKKGIKFALIPTP